MYWRWSHQGLRVTALALLSVLASCQLYVTDLKVVEGEYASAPSGYILIPADLNEGVGGDYLFFAVKHGISRSDAIRDIVVVYGSQRNIPVPWSYTKIPTDLNSGAGGDFVYAAYTKDVSKGRPIIDVNVVACYRYDCNCYGANMHKIPTDLNKGAKGKYIYLCYQRD